MLLKSIKLTKFRQFKDTHMVTFSTDKDKNVTIFMGDNGTGKTALAQAFTWCLYGETDFKHKQVLNKAIAKELGPNNEAVVQVEIALEHLRTDYIIVREQKYTTNNQGKLKRPDNTVFKVAYKREDGQLEFVKENETISRMQEILPKELSRYFFFDGERIGNMSNELDGGKVQEFKEAVEGILGLSSFREALRHLNGKSPSAVIKSYQKQYNDKNDNDLARYRTEKEKCNQRLSEIDDRLREIDEQELIAREKVQKYENLIEENKDSEELGKQRKHLENKIDSLELTKEKNVSGLLDVFNCRGKLWMTAKMINDALEELDSAGNIDVGIPDIHERTIEYLINRKRCICGEEIKVGNTAYLELNKLLEFIPPKSVGTLIGQFIRECELEYRTARDTFDNISMQYSAVREVDEDIQEKMSDIDAINTRLEGMKNVSELQKKYNFYKKSIIELSSEKEKLLEEKGSLRTNRDRYGTLMNELALKDENNKKIAEYEAYATYMYQKIEEEYNNKEKEVREGLEKRVNAIYKQIFNGDFSIVLDEKYNISILDNDFADSVDDADPSTAQGISVVFAFIAGTIDMACENSSKENAAFSTEVYPLVMDAPLSAFDKTRIQSVCDILPKVAEQVIIFIKDTDGDIAEEHMGDKVGLRYQFEKRQNYVTEIVER